MLNSSYGKTIESVHEIEYKIKNEKDYKDYIFKNANKINEI